MQGQPVPPEFASTDELADRIIAFIKAPQLGITSRTALREALAVASEGAIAEKALDRTCSIALSRRAGGLRWSHLSAGFPGLSHEQSSSTPSRLAGAVVGPHL